VRTWEALERAPGMVSAPCTEARPGESWAAGVSSAISPVRSGYRNVAPKAGAGFDDPHERIRNPRESYGNSPKIRCYVMLLNTVEWLMASLA